MEEVIKQAGLVLILAVIAEGSVEFFFEPFIKLLEEKFDFPLIRYVGAAAGIGLCFAYQLDILDEIGYHAVASWVGILLTGILVGRGSNYVHDFIKRYILGSPLEE